MNIQRECRLHKVGNSIRLTIPVDVVRAFGLDARDDVLLEADENGVTLKFFKVTKSRTPAVVGEEQAEAVG
jgi:bifunctional DNA-binding transcriptional regulator/antitoxin component of YhaV-PrlF toxin-antitoxin module